MDSDNPRVHGSRRSLVIYDRYKLDDSRDRKAVVAVASVFADHFPSAPPSVFQENDDEGKVPNASKDVCEDRVLDKAPLAEVAESDDALYLVTQVHDRHYTLQIWNCTDVLDATVLEKARTAAQGSGLIDIVVHVEPYTDAQSHESGHVSYHIDVTLLTACALEAFNSSPSDEQHNRDLTARVHRMVNRFQTFNPRDEDTALASQLDVALDQLYAAATNSDECDLDEHKGVLEAFRKHIAKHVYFEDQIDAIRSRLADAPAPLTAVNKRVQLRTTFRSAAHGAIEMEMCGFATLRYTLLAAIQSVPAFRKRFVFSHIAPRRVDVRQSASFPFSLFLNRTVSYNVLAFEVTIKPLIEVQRRRDTSSETSATSAMQSCYAEDASEGSKDHTTMSVAGGRPRMSPPRRILGKRAADEISIDPRTQYQGGTRSALQFILSQPVSSSKRSNNSLSPF